MILEQVILLYLQYHLIPQKWCGMQNNFLGFTPNERQFNVNAVCSGLCSLRNTTWNFLGGKGGGSFQNAEK